MPGRNGVRPAPQHILITTFCSRSVLEIQKIHARGGGGFPPVIEISICLSEHSETGAKSKLCNFNVRCNVLHTETARRYRTPVRLFGPIVLISLMP